MDANWNPDQVLESLATEEAVDGDGSAITGSTEEQAKRIFKKNASFAAEAIVWLVKYGEDKVRFDAARYVTERVMGKADNAGFSDSVDVRIEGLLEEMQEEMNNG